jgi:outer membrane protein assembly factor BamA
LLPLQAFSHPAFLCSASDSFYVVNKISIIGNKQTKAHIVLREIPFKAGDTLALKTFSLKLKAAKQNLQNTSLFNFVTIDTLRLQERNINLIITLTERWYTWPIPIFEFQERNFNDWWQRRDLNRTNYGFTLNRYNFRGRKEDVAVYAQLGYTVKYGVSYNIPYLTKSQTSGLGFSFSYARNREVAYTSINNKQQFFKNPNQFSREEWVAKLKYYYRRNIYNSHYAELKWVDSFIHDTLTTITKNYFSNNATHMNYFVLDYSFTHDRRDSKIYPLIGHFSELEIIKTGLGLLKEELKSLPKSCPSSVCLCSIQIQTITRNEPTLLHTKRLGLERFC